MVNRAKLINFAKVIKFYPKLFSLRFINLEKYEEPDRSDSKNGSLPNGVEPGNLFWLSDAKIKKI